MTSAMDMLAIPPAGRPTTYGQLAWLLAAAALGFLVTWVSVSLQALPRDTYVLMHLAVSGGLFAAYAIRSRTAFRELIGDSAAGLRGGLVSGALMIAFVLAGPSSAAPRGLALAWALFWLGIVYAIVDALLLSVLPVLIARRIAAAPGWAAEPGATKVLVAGLAASMLLTTTYHLGFPEFQGPRLLLALVGNGILTLGYLATRSALSPVIGHVLMHMCAVVYGYASALPVPPHY